MKRSEMVNIIREGLRYEISALEVLRLSGNILSLVEQAGMIPPKHRTQVMADEDDLNCSKWVEINTWEPEDAGEK